MPDFNYDAEHPLDRYQGETAAAHTALNDYYNMGSGRSLRGLSQKYRELTESDQGTKLPPTRRMATISSWSTTFQWQERVDQADRLQRREEERLKAEAMAAEAAKWAERRIQVRERDWNQAERLRMLADQILDEGPKFLKTKRKFIEGKDGAPDKEIITVAIDAKLMTGAMVAASKLQRLAAEMETEHTLEDTVCAESIEEVRSKRWEKVQSALADALGMGVAGEDDENDGASSGGADA